MESEREVGRQLVGICAICEERIYVDSPKATAGRGLPTAIREVTEAHLLTHSELEIARFQLRRAATELPPEARTYAIKQIFAEMRKHLGPADTCGTYTMDDVLGSASVYRLWHDACTCRFEGCHHEPLPA